MAGIEALINQAFKDLSQLSSNDYIQLLNYYGNKINTIINAGQSILSKLEKQAELYDISERVNLYTQKQLKKLEEGKRKKIISEREIEYYKNYVKASMDMRVIIQDNKKEIDLQRQNATVEMIIKKGYEILHELRAITTGHPTTFTVLVNIGTESHQIIKEVQLPLEEILNIGYLTADFHGGPSLSSTFKMRLYASKKTQREWTKKYISKDITKAYENFKSDKSALLNTINIGRQYELFKSSSNILYLENSILGQQTSVNSDTTSFVKGVDYISKDSETGQYSYESLKSFMGRDPSLANLSTILNTLSNIQNIINTMNTQIEQATMQQLNSGEVNETDVINGMVRNEIENKFKEIFGSLT